MIGLPALARALTSGGLQGGPCGDTDPLLRLASGLPCAPLHVPEGVSRAYVQRTMARRAAMQALDALCYWHLLLVEVPPDFRLITAARRELHVKLRNSQMADDMAIKGG